jgi:AraC-like DNA-binding protein
MYYQKYLPDPKLNPYVVCYYVWKAASQKEQEVQSPPSGYCAIVFNMGDVYHVRQGQEHSSPVCTSFLSGQFTSNYQLTFRGNIHVLGVVLKPTALYNFFSVRMSTLVNNRMPLSYIVDEHAETLWQQIHKEPDEVQRKNLLEQWLLSLLPQAKARLSVIDDVVAYIEEKNGSIIIEEVAAHFRISRRYLEKRFQEKVGVSPKFYARIKRFAALSYKLAYSEKVDWQDFIFESGFHDQSHLAKEFNEFNRMNPSDYYRSHQEMVRLMKKKKD